MNILDFRWRKNTVIVPGRIHHCRFHAQKQLLLSVRLIHRNSEPLSVCLSVCLSVTRVDQSKTVQTKITKFSPSAAWKTLFRNRKAFHKFEGGHPERKR